MAAADPKVIAKLTAFIDSIDGKEHHPAQLALDALTEEIDSVDQNAYSVERWTEELERWQAEKARGTESNYLAEQINRELAESLAGLTTETKVLVASVHKLVKEDS